MRTKSQVSGTLFEEHASLVHYINNMSNEEKSKRKKWTLEETMLLLSCFKARKEEFKYSRKKKFAYERVLEDMQRQGFADTKVTVIGLEAKMRTLLVAYKNAKDSNNDGSLCIAPYIEEMDEIFGTKSITSEDYSFCHKSEADMEEKEEIVDHQAPPLCLSPSMLHSPLSKIESLSPPILGDDGLNIYPTSLMPAETSSSSTSRVRKTAKERYYEAKLEIKRKQAAVREEYYNKKLRLQEEKSKELLKCIEKLLKEK